jgi:putative ABC transport system substrate-binding protein
VASAGIDYFELGRQTGAMAAKVLKGEATCDEIPFETITEYGIYLNNGALAEMQITVPSDIAEKAIVTDAE